MTSKASVLEAVSNDRALSSQGLMQRLFAFWFDAFVYNQIWEDPQVDLKALRIDRDSRILTISSGGCNALNYMLAGPQSVTAVDLNRYHIYLLRLKIAAVRSLDNHEDFFRFFGLGKHPQNVAVYHKKIADKLDADAREFWESNGFFGDIFFGDRIGFFSDGGLYDHSRNGFFLRFFHRFAHLIGLHPEKLLAAETLEEQQELFDRNIAPFFDSRLIKTVGRLPITMFGLGIPPQQLAELDRDIGDGTLIDIYRERIRRLACDFPISENYFAWQALARKYDAKKAMAVPEYLKPNNYEQLRAAVNRLETHVGSVTDVIASAPAETFNRFVFLDAQDWMDAAAMTDLWRQIAEKGETGSRIIFRTAAASSPLERNLPPGLLSRFRYERQTSAELFRQDRASIYGGFHLYVLGH